MKKSSFYFLVGTLNAIAVIGLLSYFNLIPYGLLQIFGVESPVSIEVINRSPSPTHDYIATTRRVCNGVGWCEVRTNLDKRDEQSAWETEFVFITGCDTDLDFKWEGERSLNITYSAKDENAGIHTYQRFLSKDQAVKISYLLKQ